MVWIWPMMKLDQTAGRVSTQNFCQSAVKTKFTSTFLHLRASNEIICNCIKPVAVGITSLPSLESLPSQLQ